MEPSGWLGPIFQVVFHDCMECGSLVALLSILRFFFYLLECFSWELSWEFSHCSQPRAGTVGVLPSALPVPSCCEWYV
jgi:hypothetical protein